jgi:hypothetical protein
VADVTNTALDVAGGDDAVVTREALIPKNM